MADEKEKIAKMLKGVGVELKGEDKNLVGKAREKRQPDARCRARQTGATLSSPVRDVQPPQAGHGTLCAGLCSASSARLVGQS